MYDIIIPDRVKKQLQKVNSDLRFRFTNVLKRIKIRPYHFIKRKENSPLFIARVGEYRIVLKIDNKRKIIYVEEFGHRKNIYQ